MRKFNPGKRHHVKADGFVSPARVLFSDILNDSNFPYCPAGN